eukprot:400932-Rhodomonas_salina.1
MTQRHADGLGSVVKEIEEGLTIGRIGVYLDRQRHVGGKRGSLRTKIENVREQSCRGRFVRSNCRQNRLRVDINGESSPAGDCSSRNQECTQARAIAIHYFLQGISNRIDSEFDRQKWISRDRALATELVTPTNTVPSAIATSFDAGTVSGGTASRIRCCQGGIRGAQRVTGPFWEVASITGARRSRRVAASRANPVSLDSAGAGATISISRSSIVTPDAVVATTSSVARVYQAVSTNRAASEREGADGDTCNGFVSSIARA